MQRCVLLAFSLALLGVPLDALARQQHAEVGELSQWADEMVANGRADQLSIRFEPLVVQWRASGRGAEALKLLQLWSALRPKEAFPLRGVADALMEQKDYAAALEAYSAALKLEDHAGARLGVALAFWELGDGEAAAGAFENVLAKQPSSFDRFQWARFLEWRGDSSLAWEVLEGLPLTLLNRPEVALLRAKTCLGSAIAERPRDGSAICVAERAVELAEAAVALLPEHAEAHYVLARALLGIGDRTRSRAVMQEYGRLLAQDLDATVQP